MEKRSFKIPPALRALFAPFVGSALRRAKGRRQWSNHLPDDHPVAVELRARAQAKRERKALKRITDHRASCKHARCTVAFDRAAAAGLSAARVRKRWPRWDGPCPDCGLRMLKYASSDHFFYGDW